MIREVGPDSRLRLGVCGVELLLMQRLRTVHMELSGQSESLADQRTLFQLQHCLKWDGIDT